MVITEDGKRVQGTLMSRHDEHYGALLNVQLPGMLREFCLPILLIDGEYVSPWSERLDRVRIVRMSDKDKQTALDGNYHKLFKFGMVGKGGRRPLVHT